MIIIDDGAQSLVESFIKSLVKSFIGNLNKLNKHTRVYGGVRPLVDF